jgi:hypothetical protein
MAHSSAADSVRGLYVSRNVWLAGAAAIVAIIGSGLTYMAGIPYFPSILMFVAALLVLGVTMIAEDSLLIKYDTPHDEDKHPPALILLRFGRAAILIVLGILVFYLAV